MRYRSQSAYGIHGLHICTPVSLLVCKHFIEHSAAQPDVFGLFPAEQIERFMGSAHALYMRRFASANRPALLSELIDLSRLPSPICEVPTIFNLLFSATVHVHSAEISG